MLILLYLLSSASAHDVHVQPFVQSTTPTSVWLVWETTGGEQSLVEYGPTEALGQQATGSHTPGPDGLMLHEVQLTGLASGQPIFYKVVTDDAISDVYRLRVPDAPDTEAGLRIVAMSDMQQDSSHPEVFKKVVHDGIIPWLEQTQPGPTAEALDLIMIPGDLVDDGLVYDEWRDTFFEPLHPLSAQVPIYPVPGNHERDSDTFFRYFHLPENGTPEHLEHWYYTDHSNVRVIGLDSNGSYLGKGQLPWLEGVLEATCTANDIDFVFAQLHHPHKSELWRPGENPLSNAVIEQLSAFSTRCGKPVVHFYGHTHGYSRGQAPEHRHLMVNVATAGGAIDDWGDYPQQDYPEYSVSTPDYGFVVLDVQAGDEPQLDLTRISQGDPANPVDNAVTDTVHLRLNNRAPTAPVWSPTAELQSPDCLTLAAEPFEDPDGDAHRATHWQVALDCDFVTLVDEVHRNRKNVYFGQDLQADDDLTDERFTDLSGDTSLCARVRFRDEGLVWSEWSEPLPLLTGPRLHSDNAVLDGGAELLAGNWSGDGEIAHHYVCDGPFAAEGARYFAPSGACGDGSSELHQEVNLPAGEVVALSAQLWGETTVTAELMTEAREVLGSASITSTASEWTTHRTELPRHPDADTVRIRMVGTGFVDDVSVRVGAAGEPSCDRAVPERACGCSTTGSPGFGALGLALLVLLRRRP